MNHHVNPSNNLTALRWLAALMVLYAHAFEFLGQKPPHFLGMLHIGPLGVWIFFSISGYLIMQSWMNDPHLLRFLAKRALRIFPALFVCIVLCAFVLGPALSTLDLPAYFQHPLTWGYLANIFLYINFHLPGVFADNKHLSAVNGSLWSLPVEFFMYLVVAMAGILKAPRWVWPLLGLLVILLAQLWAISASQAPNFYRTDVRQVVICGSFFIVGAAFYRYNIERFFNLSSVGTISIAWICLASVPDLFLLSGWIILPFIALGFGLSQGRWLSQFAAYDYSYGIYIYAFPVQQTLVFLYPQQTVNEHLVSAILVTLGLAALSWHLVEKRVLKLKPYASSKAAAVSQTNRSRPFE
jgi:peptidoglycan/LPS O-acetylase OafA/YrhL